MRMNRVIIPVSLVLVTLLFFIGLGDALAMSDPPSIDRAKEQPASSPVLQTTVTPTLTLITPSSPQPVTATIDIPVMISDAIDLTAFEFDLSLDLNLVQVSGVSLSGTFGDTAVSCDAAVSRCAVALGPLGQPAGTAVGGYSYGNGPGFTGSGLLATLHLQPTGESGTVTLDILNPLVADTTANLTVPDVQGASFEVIRRNPLAGFIAGKTLNAAQLEDGASITAYSSVWSTSTTYQPENAIDSSESTRWRTGSGQSSNQFLKVQIANGQDYVIDTLFLKGSSSSVGPQDFELRVSTTTDDDAAFTTVFAGTVPQDNSRHEFNFPPVKASYLQLVILNNYGGTYIETYDFDVLTRDREGGIVSLIEGPPASIAGFSSQYSSSLAPENAIDDNTGTYWRPASGQITDQWIKVDLSGSSHTIDRVQLQSRTSGVAVRDFEIRVSTTTADDAAFTTVFSGTAANNSTLQEFSFAPTEARYVQLFIKNNHGNTCCTDVSVFKVLTTDGANVARLEGVGAAVIDYSSQYSTSYLPEYAVDYNSSNLWISGNGLNTDQFIKLRLLGGESYLIDRVLIRGNSGSTSPKNFQVRVSNTTPDNAAFSVAYNGTLPSDGLTHWVTFPPVEAKYVELFIFDNYGSSLIYVYEFRVFASDLGGAIVPFDNLSKDFDGIVTNWDWNFGDGNTSTEEHPIHTYAAPGTYTVSLTVTDNDGLTDTASLVYTVQEPPTADFTFSPAVPNEGQTTYLTDASQGANNVPIVGWLWEFDYTTTQLTSQNPTTSFPDNGTYVIKLTATDSHLLTSFVTKTITTTNAPPTVFAGSDQTIFVEGTLPLNTTVSDPGTDDISTLTCDWDFGDGQTAQVLNCNSTSARVPHTYTEMGNYVATLTVTDKDGASTSDSLNVNVIKRDSQVIIFGARSINPFEAEVKAGLFDVVDWDNTLPGRVISFTWDTEVVTGTTDSNGIATVVAPLGLGREVTLTATFNGDRIYNAASDTNVLRVATTLPSGDIVFMIDESGSMGDDQAEVRNRVNNIADQLGFAIDYQFGLVGFGAYFGTNYAGEPHILTPLTSDLDTFRTAVGNLVASGGFEPGFEATILGMSESMGFREGAGVCTIIITDEDADYSSQAPATRADALAALNARDAIFLGIVNPGSGNTSNDYGPNVGSLSEATGGAVFNIINFRNNPGPVLSAIVDDCAQAIIESAPPDLVVSKTDGLDSVDAGSTLDYTITITNNSIQDAMGVLITDTLPLNTTFVSASDGGSAVNDTVTWPAFTLPFATTITRTVTIQVSTVFTEDTVITNTVTAVDDGVNGVDPTPENNTATDTTTVIAITNRPPDAVDDFASTLERTPVVIDVLANDSDPDNDPLTVITFTQPLSGTAVLNQSGITNTITYTPVDSFYYGVDTFDYTISDGNGGEDTATVTVDVTPLPICELYPIALHVDTLAAAQPGDILPDIFNGANPGNFGWLTWTGSTSANTLATSLTPPGDSYTYVNIYDPDDHIVSVGDWVQGKPGVTNANPVRQALEALATLDSFVIPVWDIVEDGGSNTNYHVVDFALVKLIDFQVPEENRITAQFLGYTLCGEHELPESNGAEAVEITTAPFLLPVDEPR